jgi:insecticidal toxin complex protein TccC
VTADSLFCFVLGGQIQPNTLELDDKAQTLSYEHYYPYGGTAIIAGKDKTQVQQKRYRNHKHSIL